MRAMEIDAFIVVVLAVAITLVVAGVVIAMTRRGTAAASGRVCSGCGAEHPAIARHCRRCGKLL
jgi:ribosomal protein L40E